MKKICVLIVLFCAFLFSCSKDIDNDAQGSYTIKCTKESMVGEKDYSILGGNYILGYIVMDGKLNRTVHVREYMRDSFLSQKEYENYMGLLQDSYLLQLEEDSRLSAIMPYFEPDRIVYPYYILDYTDLGKYTETEVPTQVRTEDGKSIDFELYWEYIQQNGVLDGFACTLEK